MEKGELLPCPFCGGKADPVGWESSDGRYGPACDDCGASADSAEVWNRRSDLAGLIAGLKEAAVKLEALADTADKLADVLSPHSAYRERVEGSAYRKGATAIRAMIGTDTTTDSEEG